MTDNAPVYEKDHRFRTGRWRGFWTQGPIRSRTELDLTFRDGTVSGEGHDWVGDFAIKGTYDTQTGRVEWSKVYIGSHRVDYDGNAERTDGIWGLWSIAPSDRGGFQIWPDESEQGAPSRQTHEQISQPTQAPRVYEADPAFASAF